MSKYTTQVRFICEEMSGLEASEGYGSVDKIIENSRAKIFDFDYPIYDETYRPVLETKILKHYYTREIGCETVGLWKLWLNTRMNEIMPYYNQRYESTLIKFNPLYDTDVLTNRTTEDKGVKDDTGNTTGNTKEEFNGSKIYEESNSDDTTGSKTGNKDVDATTSATSNSDKWDYYSDTPQGGINGLNSNTYLTNARHNTDKTTGEGSDVTHEDNVENYEDHRNGKKNSTETTKNTSESNSTGTNTMNSTFNNTGTYIESIIGKRGGNSYSKLLQEFRETFVNIDLEIINELNDLFMCLW